jgi:hypothetical protein
MLRRTTLYHFASSGLSLVGVVLLVTAEALCLKKKITWGAYSNNLGHTDFPGWSRCRHGNHTSAERRTISNDCATCHHLLAVGGNDPRSLTELGTNPSPQFSTGGASK